MSKEFKIPFFLTAKSLIRGRKWTLFFTIFLMAIAFVNLIFVSALFNGIVQGSNQQVINTLTGNIYMNPGQGESTIKNVASLKNKVSKKTGVKNVTSTFEIPARIESDSRSGRWSVLAINPDEYTKVINIKNKMYQGKYLNADDKDGILLGRQIIGGDDLEMNSISLKNVKVGDKVNVIFDNFTKTFTVRGVYYTKFVQSDTRAFISEKALTNLLPAVKNQATTINIKTDGQNDNKVLDSIKTLDPKTDTYSWTESAGLMRSVSDSFTSINVIMTIVGAIIAAVTTFIVIYVDIINRRRQIGILRAIGIRSYIIVFNYILLAAVYATLGIILGTLIFYAVLVPYFVAHPFSLPITDAVLDLNWVDYISRLEIISWVAVFAGIVPPLIVVRTDMLGAIRGR